ncbi:SOS response-associated peptidase [Paractinoplanes brasiliensis]|uniref:Abasic site processing protein n=1 Tax=Paractinoplanes brasiliensis TaxID=52695 RepID=A0A4R6JVW1_9ACTN|nr:SOS response-associated peptidase [Actinoplanes brasiliensis]TDO40387.1 putative SOS response-associated peptidase YedK [Actinoplanes brasiliensis]GID25453.1 DUF159 family protein [Actinoplanes brasiliensis]
MCGRYATTRSAADLEGLFEAVAVAEQAAPSWNVAPTDPVPVIRMSTTHSARVVDRARWGLVPPWSPDLRAGARMINARSETVATSKAFAPSFARRRCLVPADGWYEWVERKPHYMTPADGSVLAFAGIWTTWGPEATLTCSVLTTAAVGDLARVHDRMPLILPPGRWASWLAGGGDPAGLLQPLSPAELQAIEIRPVRPDVGNVRNNGPHLLEPSPAADTTPATLF